MRLRYFIIVFILLIFIKIAYDVRLCYFKKGKEELTNYLDKIILNCSEICFIKFLLLIREGTCS